jgi:hypothetical protein
MMRIVARRRIPVRFGASHSEDLRLDRIGKAPAPCGSWPSRNLRGYESESSWINLSSMYQNLCRPLVPRPKFGRSRPTAAAAAPATFRFVRLQVVGREQMTIAADIGYGHGLEDTPSQGKAHHFSFGCFKARPRYQCCIKTTNSFSESRLIPPQLPPRDHSPDRRGSARTLLRIPNSNSNAFRVKRSQLPS